MKAIRDAVTIAALREGISDAVVDIKLNEWRSDYVENVVVNLVFRQDTPLKQIAVDRHTIRENFFRLTNPLIDESSLLMIYFELAEESDLLVDEDEEAEAYY